MLWNNNDISKEYCEWLGWSEEEIEANKREDMELIVGWLYGSLEEKSKTDIMHGLSRVISDRITRSNYYQSLVENSEFWLGRNVQTEQIKIPFYDWFLSRTRDSSNKIMLLTCEAAMRKSALINMLTIHLCSRFEYGIIPIRIKLREVHSLLRGYMSNNLAESDFLYELLPNSAKSPLKTSET